MRRPSREPGTRNSFLALCVGLVLVGLATTGPGMGEGSWATGVRIGVNPETGVAGILSKESVLRLGKVRPVD
jgi:hypothetical protein